MADPHSTSSKDGEDRTRDTLLRAHAGDPLGILIVDRLSLSPLLAALVALAAALVVDTISFALVGTQVIELFGWADMWAYGLYLYVVFPTIVGACV
jgi:hypothetical protein